MKLTDIQKWPKDGPDDPAPALGWMAAREAAAAGVGTLAIWAPDHMSRSETDKWISGASEAAERIVAAILALPAPTPEHLLAEALKLPEVAALVEAAQACVHTSPPHKSHVALESALAAIKEATQ